MCGTCRLWEFCMVCSGESYRRTLWGAVERQTTTGCFSAVCASPSSLSTRMSFVKKLKKSRQPSKQPMSLGIPTQIAVGVLGMSADLDTGVGSGGPFRSARNREIDRVDLTIAPDENDRRGSRIVIPDSSKIQQAHPSSSSTPFREREDNLTCMCIYVHSVAADGTDVRDLDSSTRTTGTQNPLGRSKGAARPYRHRSLFYRREGTRCSGPGGI